MTEYGLSIGSLYSDVTDQELDQVVSETKVLFPNSGYRMMQGHLLNQGYRITKLAFKIHYKGLILMELPSVGVLLLRGADTK